MTPYQAYDKAYNLGKRIPELEPIISKDIYSSYWYAIEVIKGRLPDFMHNQMIFNNNKYTKHYIKFISKNPD